MPIFFTTDLHLHHDNIMRYCHRPFLHAGAMNEALIRGNHDRGDVCALSVWPPVRDMTEICADGQRFSLRHYPMRECPGMRQDIIHLYGHVHNRLIPEPVSLDVGVDANPDYALFALPEILEKVLPSSADTEKKRRFFR